MKTDIIHGLIRDEKNNMLSQLLFCDRLVYVTFSPVLHSLDNLNYSKCRIMPTSKKYVHEVIYYITLTIQLQIQNGVKHTQMIRMC